MCIVRKGNNCKEKTVLRICDASTRYQTTSYALKLLYTSEGSRSSRLMHDLRCEGVVIYKKLA